MSLKPDRDTSGLPGTESAAERLAAEYLVDLGKGLAAPEEAYLARLGTECERDEFRRLLQAIWSVRERLPSQVAPGVLLGGRFRLERLLGSGGMGKVFAAQDTRLGRQVAVKLLHPLSASDADLRRRFDRESRILAAMRHPGIVTVHETGAQGDMLFLVMDLVPGCSVAEIIGRARARRADSGRTRSHLGEEVREAVGRGGLDGRPGLLDEGSSFRTVARIAVEMLHAIEAAHRKSIVHRDLTPANVMLTAGGHPVILDFGLGGVVGMEASFVTRGLFGSVAYLAPEQTRSLQTGADFRTDIYQSGLVIYEMLTLERAFPQETIGAVLDSVTRGDFIPPRRHDPGIPGELEAIILRALALEPADRYPTATELREDIERFLAGARPLAARPRHGVTRLGSMAAWLLLAVAAMVLALWAFQPAREVLDRIGLTVPGLMPEDKRSPFGGVRWRETQPQVEVEGMWYDLLAVDRVPAAVLVEFCRREYGGAEFEARPLWRKRFEEDLVEAFRAATGRRLGRHARLEVRRLDDGRAIVLENVPVTGENRLRIWQAAYSGEDG